ncbi:ABC transporter substrate-binding protein [Anaerosphaera multitolerans]|uniref:ABC transporter substrate-binding protein n=1 Tax=Anaerosphaera multitolerans TaxID=2487351 RepID=A0A437S7T6_9FIRM|nr:ABC transporter substrate-binding protein [Anaerosphaera multitolerans]RVU54991.1 ABC transporter substrate-binding protein [Anaerosphaera multitolerans]
MKKRLIVIVMSLALLLTACGSKNGSTDDNTIKVGIIQFSQHVALDRAREGFIKQLEEDGFNLEYDIVNVQGDISLIPTSAKKFESDGVDLIYAIATPAAQGAMNAVENTPIVFNAVTDPVKAELVASNEKPGGIVTGVSDYFSIRTQLENFLEAFPESKSLGVLYSTGETNSESQVNELKEITTDLGMELVEIGVNTTNDVPQAMQSLTKKIDSYVAILDNLASSSANIISEELIKNKIPSFASEGGPVENGILMSDGIDYEKLGEEAAKIAEQIKNGENVGDIPVVFSKDITRIVNKNTADKLEIKEDSKIFENAEVTE